MKKLSASPNWWISAKGSETKPNYITLNLDFSQDKQEKKETQILGFWWKTEAIKPWLVTITRD